MSEVRYEYGVKVNEIIPPLHDEAKYEAKVNFCFKFENGKKIEMDPKLGIVWGKTRNDAYGKMMDKLRKWEEKIKAL
jgi:hypothetical protein